MVKLHPFAKAQFLSESDKKRIADTISEVERTTSGEVVVSAVGASSHYSYERALATLLILVLVSLGIWLFEIYAHWAFPLWEVFLMQSTGLCLGWILTKTASFRRFIPTRIQTERVHRESLATFTAQGLSQTKERTGVLIFLSHFEHRVEILADEGIHKAVSQDFWKERADAIAEGFRTASPAEAICREIQKIGEVLSRHFPPDGTNPDELSNLVRS